MKLKMAGAAVLGAFGLFSAAAALPAAAASAPAPVPTPPPGPAPAASRIEDQIERYVAASRPGAEHEWLGPLVGSWKMDATWYAPPHEPTHASGTSENRWVLGGRFLLCEATAGEGAARIDALTIYGFDNRQKRFFALGLDNLSTYSLRPSGTYDPVDRSFILSGKERDELTGNVLVYREVLKIDGPDHHSLQVFFDLPGRAPLKLLEATFTRR